MFALLFALFRWRFFRLFPLVMGHLLPEVDRPSNRSMNTLAWSGLLILLVSVEDCNASVRASDRLYDDLTIFLRKWLNLFSGCHGAILLIFVLNFTW